MKKLIILLSLFITVKAFSQAPTTPYKLVGNQFYADTTINKGDSIKIKVYLGSNGSPELTTKKQLNKSVSLIQTQLNGKQSNITIGTNLQYIKGDLSLGTFPSSFAPSGTAGGDLAGTYPNPTLKTINSDVGVFGNPTQSLTLTLDAKGRVVGAAASAIQIGQNQVTDLVANLAAKQNSIGYSPENIGNKATTFSILNNNLYPTTQAVADYISGLGGGTVTSLTDNSANGISITWSNRTSTPVPTVILGAINPTSVNGVNAATMAYNDATSSIQNQLDDKQTSLGYIPLNRAYNLSDLTSPSTALVNIGGIGPATVNTLTNKSMSGSSNTFTNIPNSAFVNSTISGISLGNTLFAHSAGYGISGSNYTGAAIQTWTADTTSASGLMSKARAAANYATLTGLAGKQSTITTGTPLQYFRGDLSLATLNTANVPELTNLYYTNARGIGSILTGYTSGAGTISSSDNILQAIQKLNGNISTGYIPNNNTATASSGYAFYVSGNGQVGGTFKVGSYVSTASTGISVSQLVTTANNHGIEIARVINPSSASGGVAEIDVRSQTLGSFDVDHFVGIQLRNKSSSSANTNNMNGVWVLDEMDGSGIVYSRNGVRIEDINKSGVGDLQNNIGLYVAPQLNGSLTNYNILSSGGKNAFTGKVKIGSGGATNPTENLYVIGDTYLDGAVTTATGFRSSLFSGSKIVTTSGTSIVEGTTGTGVITALGVNTGAVGAFVVNGGALGTPSSGTITNLSGTCASCTIGGSAATLTTTRTIWGQNFNGSANVSGAITGATSITANGIVTGVNLFATTTGGNPEVRLTPVTTGTSIISLLNVAGSSPIIGYQGVLRMGTVTGGAGAGTVNTMTLDASNNVNVTNALTVGSNATVTGNTTSTSFIKSGGTNTQFLMADGSVNSSTYLANPMTTLGDIIYGGASGVPTRLAIGGANTVLHGGTIPSYSAIVQADVTNGYMDLSSGQLATGTKQFTNIVTPILQLSSSGFSNLIRAAVTQTASWNTYFPDKSGTVALTSDIPPFVRLTGSGTGAATTISIPHGLSGITSSSIATVQPINAASTGISYITTDATNINIIYTVAPANGTNNLSYNVSIKP